MITEFGGDKGDELPPKALLVGTLLFRGENSVGQSHRILSSSSSAYAHLHLEIERRDRFQNKKCSL